MKRYILCLILPDEHLSHAYYLSVGGLEGLKGGPANYPAHLDGGRPGLESLPSNLSCPLPLRLVACNRFNRCR